MYSYHKPYSNHCEVDPNASQYRYHPVPYLHHEYNAWEHRQYYYDHPASYYFPFQDSYNKDFTPASALSQPLHSYRPPIAHHEAGSSHHLPSAYCPNSLKPGFIDEVQEDDVLCGRGAPTSWHPGNQYFRQLVAYYQPSYLAARRADKPEIAMRIVKSVAEQGGRFLKRVKVHGTRPGGHFCWQDIGENRAYEKACQALREGAPELRRQMVSLKIDKDREDNTSFDIRRNTGDDRRDDEDDDDLTWF